MAAFEPLKTNLGHEKSRVSGTHFVQATCMETVLAGLARLLWKAAVHDTNNPAAE
jgi:hypothetical protein